MICDAWIRGQRVSGVQRLMKKAPGPGPKAAAEEEERQPDSCQRDRDREHDAAELVAMGCLNQADYADGHGSERANESGPRLDGFDLTSDR